jgi:hypothetical protein
MNISLFLSCPDYFFCKFPVVGFTLRKTDGFTLRKFAGFTLRKFDGAKLLITPCKSVEKDFLLPTARNLGGNLERKRTLSIPLLRGKTPLLWE